MLRVPPEKFLSPGTLLLWQLLICGILGGLGTIVGRQHGEVERSLVQAGPTCRHDWSKWGKSPFCAQKQGLNFRPYEGKPLVNKLLMIFFWDDVLLSILGVNTDIAIENRPGPKRKPKPSKHHFPWGLCWFQGGYPIQIPPKKL